MGVFFERVVAFFTSLVLIISNFLGLGDTLFNNKTEDFKVTTYVRGDYIQNENSLYGEDFDIVTDAILFECASFNSNGEVVYE